MIVYRAVIYSDERKAGWGLDGEESSDIFKNHASAVKWIEEMMKQKPIGDYGEPRVFRIFDIRVKED